MEQNQTANESFENEIQNAKVFSNHASKIRVFAAFISDQRQSIAYLDFPMHPKQNETKLNRMIIDQKWNHIMSQCHPTNEQTVHCATVSLLSSIF